MGRQTVAVVFTEQTAAIVELQYEKNRMTILGKQVQTYKYINNKRTLLIGDK